MFDLAMARYSAWRKAQPESNWPVKPPITNAPYLIFLNGNGKFKIEERDDMGEYRSTLMTILLAAECKSIANCHEKMAELFTARKREEFRQVWP